ncbi:uncharacterized protein [Elaeis guineensis]|uniref:uncharacterized protein n=1 Tax=Elaeis guineensis var. tenera TaxID=51953 RepID=UPI003C6CD376
MDDRTLDALTKPPTTHSVSPLLLTSIVIGKENGRGCLLCLLQACQEIEGQKSFSDYDFHTTQPLFRHILDEPIPSQFKMMQVEPYDGSTDPIIHFESYKALVIIQEATDALLYISFLTTLQKAARAWYNGLQLKNIDSFKQLDHSFVAHFSTSRRPSQISDSLFSIKEKETETLRDFMARFNTAILEVRDLNKDMAVSAMKRDMRGSRFSYSLDKTLLQTYAKLLKYTYKYIRTDEAAFDR